jgi:hypothetical protein
LKNTLKREAAKASLHRTLEDQITTPFQLFEFCKKQFSRINVEYCSVEEYK